MAKTTFDYERIYSFYKVDKVKENSKDFMCNCPFCEDEEHLSISKTEGIFRCLKCESKGNVFSFFSQLHAKYLALTTETHYEELAHARGLMPSVIKAAGIAYDEEYSRWLFPFEGDKHLSNLGVCYPKSKKLGYKVIKSPELPLKLFRPFDRKRLKDDVWIFEGEWDLLAARCAMKAGKITTPPSLVSSGGSTTWTKDMNKALQGLSPIFFWDNDEGGQDKGIKAITKALSGVKSFSFTNWEAYEGVEITTSKDGKIKDVRDLWTSRKERKAKSVADELFDLSTTTVSHSQETKLKASNKPTDSEYDTDVDAITPITDYDEYQSNLDKDGLYFNGSMRKTTDLTMACCLSIFLPDKPIWAFIVAPASYGKSVLIEAFGKESKYFAYQSKLTAESLVSGSTQGDFSLLPTFDGRTVFIGDLTVILSQPPQVQEKLWGILREAYMGYFKTGYGNQGVKDFKDFKFCMVAGVTHAIYQHNDSEMGERFIKIDYGGRDFDPKAHMLAAMNTQHKWKEVSENLKTNIVGYYKHLSQTINFDDIPEIPTEIQEKIMALATLTTHLRTKVVKDRFEGMITRPVSESPSRFATTLNTLTKVLTWVRQKEYVDDWVLPYLQKVSFDSCPGLGLEAVLFTHKRGETKLNEIVRELHIPKTRAHQIITDFKALKILEQAQMNNGSGRRGRDVHLFALTDSIREALAEAVPTKKSKFPNRPTKKKVK